MLPPRSLLFREIRHIPLLFRLKILRILTPILQASLWVLPLLTGETENVSVQVKKTWPPHAD